MATDSWYLPVDHRNVRAFYSRGLIVPRAFLNKYRDDLLGVADGVLPLFSVAPGSTVIDQSSGGGDGFPTILEIESAAVPDGPSMPWGTGEVRAVGCVVPVASVRSVIVRSQSDATEIASREYRNIDPADLPLAMDDSLFAGEQGDIEDLRAWLPAQQGLTAVDADVLTRRGSAGGAIQILLDGLPAREVTVCKVAALATLLTDLDSNPISDLKQSLQSLQWYTDRDDASIGSTVLEAVSVQTGPEPPLASELLALVREGIRVVGLLDPEGADRYLDSIAAIIRGEREFAPFRNHGGLRSLKALLLFLLRPEPGRTKTWVDEPVNAEDEVLTLALLYSGLSVGGAGVPSNQRGDTALRGLVGEWQAKPFNQTLRNRGDLRFEVEVDGSTIRLVGSGGTLKSWTAPEPPLAVTLGEAAESDEPTSLLVADRMGWTDCVEMIVECDEVSVVTSAKRLVVRAVGAGVGTRRLRVQRFLERLADADEGALRRALAGSPLAEGTASESDSGPPRRTRTREALASGQEGQLPLD